MGRVSKIKKSSKSTENNRISLRQPASRFLLLIHPWPVHHGFHYIISRPSYIFYIFYMIEQPGNQLDISHPDPTLLCNQNAYIFYISYMFYIFYIFHIPDSCYVITVVTNNLHCTYNDFHYIISMLSYNIFYIFYIFYIPDSRMLCNIEDIEDIEDIGNIEDIEDIENIENIEDIEDIEYIILFIYVRIQ